MNQTALLYFLIILQDLKLPILATSQPFYELNVVFEAFFALVD